MTAFNGLRIHVGRQFKRTGTRGGQNSPHKKIMLKYCEQDRAGHSDRIAVR